ncbi:hypothetical protein Tco_0001443 [Tanacetum coccineum]
MTTLAEFMIVVGADNRPPMLDKPQFLQGLPLDVYALINHHKIAKDIWDRVKLLMQGTSLSKQERECEGNMARQYTQPKRRRGATWFKEKVLLVQAHAKAKVVLIANLSSCDLDVLFEVVQIVLWYLDHRCSKHMTGNRSQLTNFVDKFHGTVKFGNDLIAKIIDYSDYQTENVTMSKVYYVKGLGHNLFSFGQFCNSDLEVVMRFLALRWHLQEIHMTWAHLEKKQTRLRLYTKNHKELFTQRLETASQP